MSVHAATDTDLRQQVHDAARRARVASRVLATLTTQAKNRALHAAADAVLAAADAVLAANAEDIETARAAGTAEAMIDRLALNPQRLDGIAAGLRQVAGLPDPVGEVLRGSTLPNGLQLRQQRVPLGVVGMVYEGRPNVTVDAFGLALKSGNAALLRGSSSAARSNEALVTALRSALAAESLPLALQFDHNDPRPFSCHWRVANELWHEQRTVAEAVELGRRQYPRLAQESPRWPYEANNVREPLFAAWIVALCPDGDLVAAHTPAIMQAVRHFQYDRLYLSHFLPAELACYQLQRGA